MYWGLPEGDRRPIRADENNSDRILEQKYGEGFSCDPQTRGTCYTCALTLSSIEEVREIVEELLATDKGKLKC